MKGEVRVEGEVRMLASEEPLASEWILLPLTRETACRCHRQHSRDLQMLEQDVRPDGCDNGVEAQHETGGPCLMPHAWLSDQLVN